MSLILNIDTSGELAQVSFSKDGKVLHYLSNESQKDHASFLQSGILQLTKISGMALGDIDAVAVTAGPGSYTGLRVGMASAKGLCYALKKPLIALNTLEVLTASAILLFAAEKMPDRYCPMIDARRMEVFTAIYDKDLNPYVSPRPLILNEMSFEKDLSGNKILFFGSGSAKWKEVCNHPNAMFVEVPTLPEGMSICSNAMAQKKQFTDLAYSEPFYLKEFQTLT
ncbi:MAG: tRNA (adenosine(37)-N6)-threonylcarbamoyltransferase complex dimerization subunit type 1 TsaB [Chitinophagaceae bacterium]|nr:tRNA (adenosine(37)-N6)-threonylcarbamoyltransferase complex dimerization subunit type 1 TsaB [Chitinophagaceae bacterium]